MQERQRLVDPAANHRCACRLVFHAAGAKQDFDNTFFVTDFGIVRHFSFHEGKWNLEPRVEIFNTFNNTNNVNPLSAPGLFDFSGLLRVGVGDPRQAQLALRFNFQGRNRSSRGFYNSSSSGQNMKYSAHGRGRERE
jgi:hypothetical protein